MRVASIAQLLNSWLGYYGASEDQHQIEEVLAQTENALRMSEWERWASAAECILQLTRRNVPRELAAKAASAANGAPAIREALLLAFPPALFRSGGLGVVPQSQSLSLPSAVDYSGRLGTEIQAGPKAYPAWLPEGWCDSSWQLLKTRWLGMSLQLVRPRHILLPRIVSVSFESCGHRIVLHW